MKRAFVMKLVATLVLGIALGVSSALWVVNRTSGSSWVANGPWRINLAVGSDEAGLYDRATVALIALFALNRSEAIYFIAREDDEGRRLTADCDYRIEGSDPDARWWSIVLYGEDHFLVPNEQGRYSFNAINVKKNDFLNHTAKTERGWGYAVFGKVSQGHGVVNKIKAVATTNRRGHGDVPVEPVTILKATVVDG